MPNSRSVLVVAPELRTAERVRTAFTQFGIAGAVVGSIDQATSEVSELRPLLVLVWPDWSTAPSSLGQSMRVLGAYAREAGAAVAMVGPERAFEIEQAISFGADEYLPETLALELLPRRLQSLRDAGLRRRPPLRARAVLLSDPDALWRLRVGGLLEAAGYHVVYVRHRSELDEVLGGVRGPLPEICLVDPFTSPSDEGEIGLEAVRLLRARADGTQLRIVVVSSAARTPERLAALEALDVHEWVEKAPGGFEAVVPLVREHVPSQIRRAPRVSMIVACRLRMQGETSWDVGVVYNLSSSGAFVRSLATFEDGARLDAELLLPSLTGAPLRLAAVVAWTSAFEPSLPGRPPPGLGLQFDGLSEAMRVELESRLWPTEAPVPPPPAADPDREPSFA